MSDMRHLSNSGRPGFAPKGRDVLSSEYRERTAIPTMQAIDAMPSAFREIINEYGYIDVYRAWRAGWTPKDIEARARDGWFVL